MKAIAVTLSAMLLACAHTIWQPHQAQPRVAQAAPAPLIPVAQTTQAFCRWPAPETKLSLAPASQDALILFASPDDDALQTRHARAYSLNAERYHLAMIDVPDGIQQFPVPSRTRFDLTGGSDTRQLQRLLATSNGATSGLTCVEKR